MESTIRTFEATGTTINTGEKPALTDREALTAIFALLGSLAEKLTGQRPIVTLTYPNGDTIGIRPGMTTMITWEEESQLHVGSQESHSMRSVPPV